MYQLIACATNTSDQARQDSKQNCVPSHPAPACFGLISGSYIWKTAYTSAVDLYRRQRVDQHFVDRSCGLAPNGDLVDAKGEVRSHAVHETLQDAPDPFVAEVVESVISRLSPTLRHALLLSVEGYSYAEIARVQEANLARYGRAFITPASTPGKRFRL